MKALLDQLRALPTLNLMLYLIGALAVISSMVVLKGIKPAYLQMTELRSEHQQLERLSKKFNLEELQNSIARVEQQQLEVKTSMLRDIPDRQLTEAMPTLLETLHRIAKQHGLRTQKLRPGEISQKAEIATVPVSMVVVGPYHNLYNWIHDFTRSVEGISVANIQIDKSPGNGGARTMAMNLVIYGRS